MTRINRACLVLAAAFLPSVASAQAPPGWTMKVKVGAPIFITMDNGDRIEGLAGSVTGDGVTVATPAGVRTAAFTGIQRAERRDGPKNGVWIGAGLGAALGFAGMAEADCPYESCRSEAAVLPIGGALYGALIGWGVDTLIKGRRVIFDRGSAPMVSLTAGRGTLGARLVFTW